MYMIDRQINVRASATVLAPIVVTLEHIETIDNALEHHHFAPSMNVTLERKMEPTAYFTNPSGD